MSLLDCAHKTMDCAFWEASESYFALRGMHVQACMSACVFVHVRVFDPLTQFEVVSSRFLYQSFREIRSREPRAMAVEKRKGRH